MGRCDPTKPGRKLMCELFGKSSLHPATINLSLPTFAAHGGRTGPHRDGWGFAYYEDSDVRVIKDAGQAADSPWLRFIEDQGLEARTVIGHIRNATTGAISIANTHPFCRELGGRMHVFAHNGVVDAIIGRDDFPLGAFRPLGATDSEYAFCVLLARLAELWRSSGGLPPRAARMKLVVDFAAALRPYGAANFLYSDSHTLFVHSHRRRRDDGSMSVPGLHMLASYGEDEIEGGGVSVASDGPGQQSVIFASVPLTQRGWIAVPEGAVLAVEAGVVADAHEPA